MKRSLVTNRYLPLILILLCLLRIPLPTFASEKHPMPDSELNRVIQKIKEKEKNIKTFTAAFRQTKKTYLLHEPLHSEGLIYFDSSGKLLMKVVSPSPLVILFNNNTFVIFYPEISKAEKRYIGNAENIIKKYIGIGQPVEALMQQYEIHLSSRKASAGYYLKMIPKEKAMAKHMDSIEVWVNPDTWLPERILFKEVKGDQTTLWLQFTSINQPLPSGIFSIALPDEDDDEDR